MAPREDDATAASREWIRKEEICSMILGPDMEREDTFHISRRYAQPLEGYYKYKVTDSLKRTQAKN